MKYERNRRLIRSILATSDDELDCETALQDVEASVDREVSGRDPDPLEPRTAQHLRLCPHCADIYRSLLEIVGLEHHGRLASLDQLLRQLAAAMPAPPPSGSTAAATALGAPSPPVRAAAGREVPPWSARVRDRLRQVSTPLQQATLAGLAVVVVALGLGWQRSSRQADELVSTIEEIGRMDHMTADTGPGGSWLRLLWNPDSSRAMLFTGRLPRLQADQSFQCWLKDRSGRSHLARTFRGSDRPLRWWIIEGQVPFSTIASVAVTTDTDDRPILEVPLLARQAHR